MKLSTIPIPILGSVVLLEKIGRGKRWEEEYWNVPVFNFNLVYNVKVCLIANY